LAEQVVSTAVVILVVFNHSLAHSFLDASNPIFAGMANFKKLSRLSKLLLKTQDAERYKDYKYALALSRFKHIDLNFPVKPEYNFKHSGNSGDIIYSLPTIYSLSQNAKANLYLHLNQPANYGKKQHPLGNVMLNQKMAEMLTPLLQAQKEISSCTIYDGASAVDFDLDQIRRHPILMSRGNIARWYFYVFAINADLGKAWLTVEPDTSFKETIVIARSQRYREPGIDYSFLRHYKTAFVGVEQEYNEMKEMIPNIEFLPVKDFLQMAGVIAGSKFFIGNQSFPFSVAEGLKVKRLLEVYYLAPNVSVEGNNGYDFCFQPQFEKLAKKLYEE
jgi:hypothetical protein